MKFPDRFLEEIKGRFRLSEYVGRSTPLKRAGHEWSALSPFVNEKTASFFVNDDKAFYHCFASGKHGDLFDWVMFIDGLDFVEAVKRLAEEAGLQLPDRDVTSEAEDRRRRHLEGVLRDVQQFYSNELRSSPVALDYLRRRGLTADDISRFGIGYAPDGSILKRVMEHPEADLLAVGVIVVPEGSSRPLDRYRNRIMFPICDAAGRLISFGARALDPKARAKYLNGPDTDLFDKGRQLYGLNMARKLLSAGPGPLIVVEGYMDVVACLRAGIAACAPMGTSLTDAQLELLWRFHPEPTLCFDADNAGRRAANRAMDMAIPKVAAKRSLRFGWVTGGKDADEVLREQGAEALRRQLTRATPLAEAIFQREVDSGPLDTPERRTDLRERLHKIAKAIPDRSLGQEYGALFRQKLEDMRRKPGSAPAGAASMQAAADLRCAIPPRQAAIAYWMIKDPARVLADLEEIERDGLGHPALAALVSEVSGWLMDHDPDAEGLAQHLHAKGLGPLAQGLLDPGHRLENTEEWRAAYRRLAAYLRLETQVQEAKGRPDQMQNFMALKAQRDEAKRAL